MNKDRYAGRTAVVTGAGSGIGQAVACQIAAEGGNVLGCDIDAEGLAETERRLGEADQRATLVRADVTAESDVQNVVGSLPDQRVDLVANVAGIMDHFVPLTELDDVLWERLLAVNLTGPMRLCRATLPLMQSAGRGAIVNVSSVGGLSGAVAGSAYVASKHGLVGLTRSIACLYGTDGIRANAVCPGGVRTNIGRTSAPRGEWAYHRLERSLATMPRMAQPAEVAALICWLGSDEATLVNGAVVAADGGWTA